MRVAIYRKSTNRLVAFCDIDTYTNLPERCLEDTFVRLISARDEHVPLRWSQERAAEIRS